jgi:hypothetical protein
MIVIGLFSMTEDFCELKRSSHQHKTAFGFEDFFGEERNKKFLVRLLFNSIL